MVFFLRGPKERDVEVVRSFRLVRVWRRRGHLCGEKTKHHFHISDVCYSTIYKDEGNSINANLFSTFVVKDVERNLKMMCQVDAITLYVSKPFRFSRQPKLSPMFFNPQCNM